MYDILIWIGFFFGFFTTPQIEVLDIHEIFSTYSSGMKVPRDKLCCGCYSISGAHENVSRGAPCIFTITFPLLPLIRAFMTCHCRLMVQCLLLLVKKVISSFGK